MKKAIVTGAGGFIGHHLVKFLKARGYWVCGIDTKYPVYEPTCADQFELTDLRHLRAHKIFDDIGAVDELYHLAADMGGIGYIETNKADIVVNNTYINMNTIGFTDSCEVGRFLFTSSACVYPGYLQRSADVAPLSEEDAYPADAEDGYGWEKLYFERVCRHYREDYGLDTRIVRLHNVYGPLGTFQGGREKSPAALCRKIALADKVDSIEVWGDGKQTRSYCYIDDCVKGLYMIMQSGCSDPLNLGTSELVSIDELVDIIAKISGKRISKSYNLDAPKGVYGRNSDNTRIRNVLNWEPTTPLIEGLSHTYRWIESQLR